MRRMIYQIAGPGLLLTALLLSGCGPKEVAKKDTYPVTGKVFLNGEPVRFAQIFLVPADETGMTAHGMTSNDGSFSLRTYSNTTPDGAVEGEYTVELAEYDPVEGGAIPRGAKPTKIPPAMSKSGKTVTITSGENNLDIQLP